MGPHAQHMRRNVPRTIELVQGVVPDGDTNSHGTVYLSAGRNQLSTISALSELSLSWNRSIKLCSSSRLAPSTESCARVRAPEGSRGGPEREKRDFGAVVILPETLWSL